jgi:FMN phosphatase YigB (HAD superfamily)
MFDAILFDLYETLVTERGTMPGRASSFGPRLGLDDVAFRKAWKPQRARVVRGELSFADALCEVGASLGCRVDPAAVHTLSDERRREKAGLFARFDREALSVVRQLRERGVKLALVSNCFPEDVEAWPTSQAAQWFDAAVFSFEVGAAKPDARIYLEAVRRLHGEPDTTLYVGDGGDEELLGAERVGLRAAQASWFRGELAGLPATVPRLSSWQALLQLATAG